MSFLPLLTPLLRSEKEQACRNICCEGVSSECFAPPFPIGYTYAIQLPKPQFMTAAGQTITATIHEANTCNQVGDFSSEIITDQINFEYDGKTNFPELPVGCYYLKFFISGTSFIDGSDIEVTWVTECFKTVEKECCLAKITVSNESDFGGIRYCDGFEQCLYFYDNGGSIKPDYEAEGVTETIERSNGTVMTKATYLIDRCKVTTDCHYRYFAKTLRILAAHDNIKIERANGLVNEIENLQQPTEIGAGTECIGQWEFTYDKGTCLENNGCKTDYQTSGYPTEICDTPTPYRDCETETCLPPDFNIEECTFDGAIIELSHNDSSGTCFEHTRPGSNIWTEIDNKTPIEFSGLNECQGYTIFIRACCENSEGQTIYSNPVQVNFETKAAPCPVPVITDCAESYNSIKFAFSDSGDYCYRFGLLGGTMSGATPFTGNEVVINGLEDLSDYSFQFQRKCPNNLKNTESDWITENKTTLECLIRADVETSPESCAGGDGTLTITNISGVSSTSANKANITICDSANNVITDYPSFDLSGLPITENNLSGGNYTIKIRDKVCTQEVFAVVGAPLSVPVPTGLTIEGCTDSAILINWTGDESHVSYEVVLCYLNGPGITEILTVTEVTAAFDNLPCFTQFRFKVCAYRADGCKSDVVESEIFKTKPCEGSDCGPVTPIISGFTNANNEICYKIEIPPNTEATICGGTDINTLVDGTNEVCINPPTTTFNPTISHDVPNNIVNLAVNASGPAGLVSWFRTNPKFFACSNPPIDFSTLSYPSPTASGPAIGYQAPPVGQCGSVVAQINLGGICSVNIYFYFSDSDPAFHDTQVEYINCSDTPILQIKCPVTNTNYTFEITPDLSDSTGGTFTVLWVEQNQTFNYVNNTPDTALPEIDCCETPN